MKVEYSKESFEKFIFDKNWIEPPLFYNNKGKVLRFDLMSKPEEDSYKKIIHVFNDLFYSGSYLYVAFYGSKGYTWKKGKQYFKICSLKKILQKAYKSRDNDLNEEKPYVVVCETQRENFKMNKYFSDYLRGEQKSCIAFISRKKASVIHFYDNRGFDFFTEDETFFKVMYNRYRDYLLNEEN